MERGPHIDLERLADFVAGRLDEAGESEVQAHLSACAGCCRRAANLPEDPFAAEVRAAWSSFRSSSWGGGLSAGTATTTEEGGIPLQIGDFHLLREAGRGGMGIVYEAVQQSLGRHIALKVLPPNAVLDPRYLYRFRREAQAVARLHHPNIAPVFGVGEEGGVHYYAMQFIRGRGLDQVLQDARAGDGLHTLRALLAAARDASPPGEAVLYRRLAEVGRQAAEALDYAHGQGVLHRDVKPSNILIDADGHAWVTDFGLAKLAGEREELTATGDLVGTLRYMAPERLQGHGDARSDVYSLGLTLYEFATVRPWSAPGHGDAIRQGLDGQAPRPRRLNPKLPRDLETIILKATAAEPSHRYATARDLAQDLGRFVENRPVLASRTSLPRRLAKWARRKPALAGLAALAAVALLAAFAGVAAALIQSERRADAERRGLVEQSAQRERIERILYASRIAQAATTWEQNDITKVLRLLDQCRPEPGREDLRGWEWNYLRRLCHTDLFPGMEHRQWVHSVAFSPDGRLIASAAGIHPFYVGSRNAPGEVKLWDAQTGRLIADLGRHGNTIDRVVFSRDGKRLASIGYDGTVQLFDPAAARAVGELPQPFVPVKPLAVVSAATESGAQALLPVLADSLAIVGFTDAKPPGLRLFDLATGAARASFGPPARGTWALTSDGLRAVCHIPGKVQVWDAVEGALLASWDDDADDVELSPDGRLVTVTTEAGRPVSVYETASGRVICRYVSAGREARFTPDGRSLINWNSKFAVRVEVAGGGITVVPLSGASFLNGVAISADGRSLAAAYSDQTVRTYDLTTGLESRIYRGHTFGVTCLAFSPDGSRLVSGGQDGTVKVWDLRQPQQGLHIIHTATNLGGEWTSSLGFRNGGRQLVTAHHHNGTLVSIVDTAAVREVACHPLALVGRFGVPRIDTAFSGDGERLAGIGVTRTDARVWDVGSGRELLRTPTQPGPLRGLALSPDARRLATAPALPEGRPAGDAPPVDVTVWDLGQGTAVAFATIHIPLPTCMAFTAEADRLAIGGGDGRVRVWRPGSGDAPQLLPGAGDTLTCVAFSPDGRRLAATEMTSGIVRVWDLRSEAPLFQDGDRPGLQGPRSLTWVTFSPDGRRIGAIGYDGVAFLWDARTGRELLTLQTIGEKRLRDFAYNARLIFSPDGRRLAANHWRFGATVWEAE